jgi:hypothetical protein
MRDLSNPKLMWLKAVLLLLIGLMSAALIVAQSPELRTLVLLCCCVWGFCRAYYFVFYVIQHYIEPGYRFAGLWHFFRWCWARLTDRHRR